MVCLFPTMYLLRKHSYTYLSSDGVVGAISRHRWEHWQFVWESFTSASVMNKIKISFVVYSLCPLANTAVKRHALI